jgi:hypothetical protein
VVSVHPVSHAMAAMLPLASRPIPSETPKILCKKKKRNRKTPKTPSHRKLRR